MGKLIGLAKGAQGILDKVTGSLDLLAPLLLRLYLVPVFYFAGKNKWDPFKEGGTFNPVEGLANTVKWFEGSLELPFPLLMAILAWGAEYIGAILLALGLAVRWIAIPLMITMVVAATTVHMDNGWQTINDLRSPFANADAEEAIKRLNRSKNILREHGNYRWLTEHGSIVSLNNGIQFAATYFVMCLALFFLGGGRYISLDYWLSRKFRE